MKFARVVSELIIITKKVLLYSYSTKICKLMNKMLKFLLLFPSLFLRLTCNYNVHRQQVTYNNENLLYYCTIL